MFSYYFNISNNKLTVIEAATPYTKPHSKYFLRSCNEVSIIENISFSHNNTLTDDKTVPWKHLVGVRSNDPLFT